MMLAAAQPTFWVSVKVLFCHALEALTIDRIKSKFNKWYYGETETEYMLLPNTIIA